MSKKTNREVWLRGPLPGISPLLQPIAHALLQAGEEVTALMEGFPEDRLWDRPAGVASPGFHLQHLTGVLDRLFTYAEGKGLTEEQLASLAAEGKPPAVRPILSLTEPREEATGSDRPEGREGATGSQHPERGREATGSHLPEEGAGVVQELVDRFNQQINSTLVRLKAIPESSLTEERGVGRAQIPSTVIGLLVHAAEHTQRHNGQLLVTVRMILGNG